MKATSQERRKAPTAVIGLGGVGRALAHALAAQGYQPIFLIGRNRAADRQFARQGGFPLGTALDDVPSDVRLILLAVKDRQVAQSAIELAKLPLDWKKITVLHTAGIYGASVLEPLARLGAGVAAFHPFQTFPKRARVQRHEAVASLRNITYGIDGNRKGLLVARRLARALGGGPIRIPDPNRARYHLSAVLSSGFVAADLHLAIHLLKSTGLTEHQARAAVTAIAAETVKNIGELGTRAALTGPAVRGDRETIRKHLKALKETLPEWAPLYRQMSAQMQKMGGGLRPTATQKKPRSNRKT